MEFNYTCSLGSFCQASAILKRNNLKKCSYPFDWIFSNYNIILHCIENNFNIFLDKSYYVDIENKLNDNQCGHKFYNSQMFNHRDVRIENNYNYYIRCVNRFNNLLQLHDKKLFIMIYVNENEIKNDIIKFNKQFSKFTNNYILFVILYKRNNKMQNYKFTYIDNIHFLEIEILSDTNGVEFINEDDNIYLDNLINNNYKLNILNI